MSVNENNPDLKKDKPYQLVIDHIKDDILNGVLKPGDRLPGERELAEQLGISRNSVREGLRILENMGVTASRHGAGHYVSLNFDVPMTEMLSLIYTMKNMGRDDLNQFRYCLEREAMHLAVDNASERQKVQIKAHLDALLSAETEKDRYEHDMALHMAEHNTPFSVGTDHDLQRAEQCDRGSHPCFAGQDHRGYEEQ